MIPYIRGRYRSYPLSRIDDEVAELVCNGVREIVLIGQDTGIWGHDLEEPSTTATLVRTLAHRYPDTWFRLLYVQPEGIDDELLDVIATYPNVCPYLDMPLQHVNAEVLAHMNRSGNAKDILALLDHVRDRVPDIMIRTTLMAGFPGETRGTIRGAAGLRRRGRVRLRRRLRVLTRGGECRIRSRRPNRRRRAPRARPAPARCLRGGRHRSHREARRHVRRRARRGLRAHGRGSGSPMSHARTGPRGRRQVHVPVDTVDDLPIGQFARVELTGSFFYELEGEVVPHAR